MNIEPAESEASLTSREATEQDSAFIFSTWLRNYRFSEFAKHLRAWYGDDCYFKEQARLITKLIRVSKCVIASVPNENSLILGYLVHAGPVIHFCYVKSSFRGGGVAKFLISSAGLDLNQCSYTHRTKSSETLSLKYPGLTYNPLAV